MWRSPGRMPPRLLSDRIGLWGRCRPGAPPRGRRSSSWSLSRSQPNSAYCGESPPIHHRCNVATMLPNYDNLAATSAKARHATEVQVPHSLSQGVPVETEDLGSLDLITSG